MADYATINTGRYRVRYSVAGQVHTAQLRFARTNTSPDSDMAAVFTDLFTAMAPNLFNDFVILGADRAFPDSEVYLPAGVLPTVTGLSAAAPDSSFRPLFCSFVGRSTSGARAILYLYGWNTSPHSADNTANDFRVGVGENSQVEDAVAVLNGVTGSNLVAIDDQPIVWYPYVNIGINGYYQRRARRS